MNTFISVNDHIKKWKEFEEGPPLCFLPNIRKIIRYYIKEKNTDNLLKINERRVGLIDNLQDNNKLLLKIWEENDKKVLV